jgi:transcriptional regulator with XRE-family HTH domain
MQTFARAVRERAKELQLSHAEIARRCGLTERRFGHYVTGAREPDLATLVKISAVLETTPNALLGLEHAAKRTGQDADLRAAIAAGIVVLTTPNLRLLKSMVDSMIRQQRDGRPKKGG